MIDPITAGTVAYKVGKGAVSTATKIIEISLPIIKQAGRISLKFIEGGVNAVIDDNTKKIELTKKLSIIDNNLNVPTTFDEKQMSSFEEKITYNLEIIKGQNEMMFLTNSINYFVKSHKNRTGIDRSIAYALQNDIEAVMEYIKKEDVRFPGYLLHQCISLTNTIEEYNIFYSSILKDGQVFEYTQEKANEILSQTFGTKKETSKYLGYIPEKFKMTFYENNKNVSDKNIFSTLLNKDKQPKEVEKILNRLFKELVSNEELEFHIYNQLDTSANKKIIVQN